MERTKAKLLAAFALFIWATTVLARSFALGGHLAVAPDRVVAIIVTFIALTTFGITIGRLWDSHDD